MGVSRTAIAAVLAVAVAPAAAQVQQVTPSYKVVEHGRSIKVDFFYSADPDCNALSRPTVNLMSAPRGGTVETASGRDYPAFGASNVHFSCNRLRLPSTQLYYRAAPDYTGMDGFTAEVVFSNGEARQYRYTVYVR